MSTVADRYVVLAPVLLTLLALYKFIIYPAFISPLARLPNAHWSSPFSPFWILWARFKRQENAALHAAHIKHGPIIRTGSKEISINSLDGGIRNVYGGGFDKGKSFTPEQCWAKYVLDCVCQSAEYKVIEYECAWLSTGELNAVQVQLKGFEYKCT